MTWISGVVVLFLFYVAVGPLIRPEPDQLQAFLYSIAAWIILSIALIILERFSGKDWLALTRLRNGMLYSTRPYISNNLAFWLACGILGYNGTKFILSSIDSAWGAMLPWDLGGMVFPSTFILIVVAGFVAEQRYRYLNDIRKHQLERKEEFKNRTIRLS